MCNLCGKYLLEICDYHIYTTHMTCLPPYSTVLQIQRGFRENASDFNLEGPEKQTSIKVPSMNFNNNGLLKTFQYRLKNHMYFSNPSPFTYTFSRFLFSNSTQKDERKGSSLYSRPIISFIHPKALSLRNHNYKGNIIGLFGSNCCHFN